MPNIKDQIPYNEPLKILLISENGGGKSIAADSFYKAGPIRVHEFDGRMAPVINHFAPMKADISYDTFDSNNFRKYFDEMEELQNNCPYKTIVTDSITSLSTSCVLFSMKAAGKFKTGQDKLPATSFDEINRETVWFTELLEASCKIIHRKFGVNIIWTAHPVAKTTIEDGTGSKISPIVSYGYKVPGIIPGYFNEIYSIQQERVDLKTFKRTVYTVPHNNLPGKTAFPNLLPDSFDITNKSFYDVLMSYLNKK